MSKQIYKQRQTTKTAVIEETVERDLEDSRIDLTDEVDSLLEEIESVLEENAESFVQAYVQKGGE